MKLRNWITYVSFKIVASFENVVTILQRNNWLNLPFLLKDSVKRIRCP